MSVGLLPSSCDQHGGFIGHYLVNPLQIESSLKLEPSNKEIWDTWVAPPISPYMKLTFFNVTNPEAIVNGDKPEVSEIGHFAYREVREKQNILPINDDISFGR